MLCCLRRRACVSDGLLTLAHMDSSRDEPLACCSKTGAPRYRRTNVQILRGRAITPVLRPAGYIKDATPILSRRVGCCSRSFNTARFIAGVRNAGRVMNCHKTSCVDAVAAAFPPMHNLASYKNSTHRASTVSMHPQLLQPTNYRCGELAVIEVTANATALGIPETTIAKNVSKSPTSEVSPYTSLASLLVNKCLRRWLGEERDIVQGSDADSHHRPWFVAAVRCSLAAAG